MSDRRFKRDRQQRLERQARRQRNMKRAAIAGGAVFCAGAFAAPAANAATFTVTNTTDSDPGSLRDAIDDANSTGGDDDIVFQAGLSGTITLTSGQLEITEEVDIQGPGASALTVSGNDDDRVFLINPASGAPVDISGLTIRDGYAGVNGGGISNIDSDFTLSDSVVTENSAGNVQDGYGGGVFIGREATIENSVISGNDVYSQSGDGGYGGGIGGAGGVVDVIDSRITGNYAETGGGGVGLYDLGEDKYGDAFIQRSTVSGNESGEDGGGVYVEDSYHGAGLIIEASTISGNHAASDGGGLCVCEDMSDNTFVTSSTISGNTAGDDGGGVFNRNNYSSTYPDGEGRELYLTGVTIAGNNAADSGGGIYRDTYDTYSGTRSVVQLTSSVVGNNTAPAGADLFDADPNPGDEIAARNSLIESPGPFTDQGRNVTGADPNLGPLADNGGPTQTHLPGWTSPVLDKGIAAGSTVDQRGQVRPFDDPGVSNAPGGDGADMGAVEGRAPDTAPGTPPKKAKKKKKCKKKKKGKAGAAAKKCKKKKKK